jgi:hypothetical protein
MRFIKYRIAWPNTPYLFDLANEGSHEPGTAVSSSQPSIFFGSNSTLRQVQLWKRYPLGSSHIWRLVRCKRENAPDLDVNHVSKTPATSIVDTIHNTENLKLDDSGEFMLTTTTTTTTTSVTKVARVGQSIQMELC